MLIFTEPPLPPRKCMVWTLVKMFTPYHRSILMLFSEPSPLSQTSFLFRLYDKNKQVGKTKGMPFLLWQSFLIFLTFIVCKSSLLILISHFHVMLHYSLFSCELHICDLWWRLSPRVLFLCFMTHDITIGIDFAMDSHCVPQNITPFPNSSTFYGAKYFTSLYNSM